LKKALKIGKKRLASWARKPKATLFFVVLCLFFVVLHGAIQQSVWMPEKEAPEPEIKLETSSAVNTPQESVVALPKEDTKGWGFFHPSWQVTPELTSYGTPKFHPDSWTISEKALRKTLLDPRSELSPDFQVTDDIRERVLFWMKIHTQYNSYMRVLHDRNDPSIVYGVADFTPLFRASKSDAGAMNRLYRYEREIQKVLKAKLSEAAGITQTRSLSPWERNQLRALLSRAGALSAAEAASRIGSVRSQSGQRDEFVMALKRSEDLLPYIEATLRSFDLPVELGRIPFVESSFNPRAYSKVGATGMWQFMPLTAKQFISHNHPELWSDPLLQTRAAARMLLIFRTMLPDWSTTVTAYNSGAGRLQRLSRKYRSKSIGRLLEAQDPTGLGFAGKNFYAQFLSANLSEAYRDEIFPLHKREDEALYLAFEKPLHFGRRFRNER
jgi:membrane-bound lytic murein transglycosylase D